MVLDIDTMVNKIDYFLNFCEHTSRKCQIVINKDQTGEWLGVEMGWGPNVDFILCEGLSWEGLCLWWDPTNESQANEYLRQKEQCLQNSDMNSLASWGNLEDGGQMQV